MHRRARVDANQTAIVDVLRRAGRSVAITSSLGHGFPDVVVGWRGTCCDHDCSAPEHIRGRLCLPVEIKDGELSPSRQRLTPDEAHFHATWRGPIMVVKTMAEALAATGIPV